MSQQRLDDMTGHPIPPLSSRQREEQRELMVMQINELTRQSNATVTVVRELQGWRDIVTDDLLAMHLLQVQLSEAQERFKSRSLFGRLRWLVLGR